MLSMMSLLDNCWFFFLSKGRMLEDLVIEILCYFFFFQAEDGIRDDLVTGVQTCALPIFLSADHPEDQCKEWHRAEQRNRNDNICLLDIDLQDGLQIKQRVKLTCVPNDSLDRKSVV